jgi:hypothetical protein
MKNCGYVLFCLLLIMLNLAPAQGQRIYVEGKKFMVDGKPIWINGTNTPWDKWNDFGSPHFNESFWQKEFEKLNQYGVNSTRVWISCDARGFIQITENGYVTGPTEKFWQDLDKLMEITREQKIYLMVTPISFDHVRFGQVERWKKMYASPHNQESFMNNYIKPLVTRYKDNPYFFCIDVANEIEWVWENHGVNRDHVIEFIARVANMVHQHSEVLVTQGMGCGPKYCSAVFPDGNLVSDASLSAKQAGAYLDFYKLHYYEWMNPWFSNPFDRSPADWGIDYKPCVIGECRANGKNAGYIYETAIKRAFDLGWQGIMPWTSNGVDVNGTIADHGPGSLYLARNYNELVYPLGDTLRTWVTAIEISAETAKVSIPQNFQLSASVVLANATNKVFQWSSSNDKILSVEPNGRITALAPGTAIITATSHDGGFKATCSLEAVWVSATDVSINAPADSLEMNKTLSLTAVVLPADASGKKVTWSSDNPVVAIVNPTGLVTAKSGGIAVITAISEDNAASSSIAIRVFGDTTGTLNPDNMHGFTISPNPANSYITIHLAQPASCASIHGMDGKVYRRFNLNPQSTVLSLEGISQGVYFIKVNHSSHSTSRKFVVE